MFTLNKFSLIIITRCNLRCRLCCEYIPVNKPFPDMTIAQAKSILSAIFDVTDRITTLHLTGGGEPFLHPELAELVEAAMEYEGQFDRLMLFTNSTVPISNELLDMIKKYKDKIIVQMSLYGINKEREKENSQLLIDNGINCKIEKYFGDDQSFGGWVDFGAWQQRLKKPEQLEQMFQNCAITSNMCGNWRTRDGRVHWCSRSQRGMELGLIPDNTNDYVNLFDETMNQEQKRAKFISIENGRCLSACDYCSGDQGTDDQLKRFPAAEQIRG